MIHTIRQLRAFPPAPPLAWPMPARVRDDAAGGGKLNHRPEAIVAALSGMQAAKGAGVSPDHQRIVHPAHPADRGPVHADSPCAHAPD